MSDSSIIPSFKYDAAWFWLKAWQREEDNKLLCPIPDTLLIDSNGTPDRWLFTNKRGEIVKKKKIELPLLKSKFLEMSEGEEGLVALGLGIDGVVKPLDLAAFNDVFNYLPLSAQNYSAIQVFIKQKAGARSSFRNEYNVVNDKSKVITSTHKIVLWEGESSPDIPKQAKELRSANMALNNKFDEITARLVKFIEFSEKCRVLSMVTEYTIDEDEQPWLNIVSSTTVIRGDIRQSAVSKESDRNRVIQQNKKIALRVEFADTSGVFKPLSPKPTEDDIEKFQEQLNNASLSVEAQSSSQLKSPKPRYMVGEAEEKQTFRVAKQLKEDISVEETHYPTPFKCHGDFCNFIVNEPDTLTSQIDILSVAKSLLLPEEWEGLKVQLANMHLSGDLSAAEWYDLTYKSIYYAKKEKRGGFTLNETREENDLNPNLGSGLARETVSQHLKKNYNKKLGVVEGGAHNFYKQLKVCATCYRVYTTLDKARDILVSQKDFNKNDRRASPSRKDLVNSRATSEISKLKSGFAIIEGRARSKSPDQSTFPEQNKQNFEKELVQKEVKEVILDSILPPLKASSPKTVFKSVDLEHNITRHEARELTNSHGRQRFNELDTYLRGEGKQPKLPHKVKAASYVVDPIGGHASSTNSPTKEQDSQLPIHTSPSTLDKTRPQYIGTILLVDEDADTRNIALGILENEGGYKVTICNDGPKALEKSREVQFDCLMVSTELPTLGGVEVTKLIRQREGRSGSKRVPIIAFTESTTPEDLRLYMEVGMDGCVSKPGDSPAIINTLLAAIPHHNPHAQTPRTKRGNRAGGISGGRPVPPDLSGLTSVHTALRDKNKESRSTAILTQDDRSTESTPGDSAPSSSSDFPVFDSGFKNGVFQLDADTVIPYTIVGNNLGKLEVPLFNFVVIHDFFDTCERQQIFWTPLVNKYPGLQVLCFNYPGQAFTEWKRDALLNNKYLSNCTEALLAHLDISGTKEFITTNKPFYILGYGNGANIGLTYALNHRRTMFRGLLLVNGFTYIDPHLGGVLHDCMNVFSCSPATRPDLPVYFYTRFLFSGAYLTKVSTPLALNMYTAVNNPITLRGRIQLCQGALAHEDLREKLKHLEIPTIAVHSNQNGLVKPSHIEPLVKARGGEIRSIQGALKGRNRVAVVWLKAGHEVFQECRKTVLSLIEQLATGYHELHDVSFFPQEGSDALLPSNLSQKVSAHNDSGPYAASNPSWSEGKVNPGYDIKESNKSGEKGGNSGTLDMTEKKAYEERFINNIIGTLHEVKANAHNKNTSPVKTEPIKNYKIMATSPSGISLDIERDLGGVNKEHAKEIERLREHSKNIRSALVKQNNTSLGFTVSSPQREKEKKKPKNKSDDPMYGLEVLDPESTLFERSTNHIYKSQEGSKIYPKDMPEVKEYMSWRVKRNKKRLDKLAESAICIQKCWRAYMAKTLVHRMRREQSALNIQRCWRGKLGRRVFNMRKKEDWAVRLVQKYWRGYTGRKRFNRMKLEEAAALNLQRMWRGRLGKMRVKHIKDAREYAVIKIQSAFRSRRSRKVAFKMRLDRNKAIEIQRIWRGYLGRKRVRLERDKYLFSKAQSQGIEFGRQMLMEHKLHGTRLQSEVSMLLKEKSTTEENVEILLREISEFEAVVKRLEKEMLELSRVEADSKGALDEAAKVELREQKIKLDREFGNMLTKIADRKERLKNFEEKLQSLDRARQIKESELGDLERKLVVLLEEQQKELNQIKIRQEKRLERQPSKTPSRSSKASNNNESMTEFKGPTPAQKKEAQQLMESTETLMKFGFMSMSMTYFSSLNMIRAIKAVGAVDTNITSAMSKSIEDGTPSSPAIAGMKQPGKGKSNDASSPSNTSSMISNTSDFQPKLKPGEMIRNNDIEVHKWSVDDVCNWLATLSLSQYKEAFQDASIDGPFLYDLNDGDLKNTLGIEHGLHRKKILNSVKRLRALDTGRDGLARAPSLVTQNIINDSLNVSLGQQQVIAGVSSPTIKRVGTANTPIAATTSPFITSPDVEGGDAEGEAPPVKIVFSELESYVRNGKYKNVKETLNILQSSKFDKLNLQQQNIPGFGTQYVDSLRLSTFHINKTNDAGNTLFLIACQNGHEKLIKFLYDKGSYINHQNNQGNTGLHFVMTYGFFEIGSWMTDKENGAGADDSILNANGLGPYDGL